MVNFKVNGTDRSFDGDPDMPLLWYLRDDLRLTGTRFGCGAGLCGACTVHVEGLAVRSCQTPVRTLENKAIVTIEGLSADGRHPVQRAWASLNVAQCGYCQTGRSCRRCRCSSRRPIQTTGHRSRHVRQHLPLRHLPAHPPPSRQRRSGYERHRNVSRRQFLGGVFSTGGSSSPHRSFPGRCGRRPRPFARRRNPRHSTRASISASGQTAPSSS